MLIIIFLIIFMFIVIKNEKFSNLSPANKYRCPSFIRYDGTTQECEQDKVNKNLCGLVRYDNFTCKGDNGCLARPVVKEEGALPTQGNIGSILSYCTGSGAWNCSGDYYNDFPIPKFNPSVPSYTSGAGNITYPSGCADIGEKPYGYNSILDDPNDSQNALVNQVWYGKGNSDNKLRTNCAAVCPETGLRTCMTGQGSFTGNGPGPNSSLSAQTLGCYDNFWPPVIKENDQCSLVPRYPQPPSSYMGSGVLQPDIQSPGPLTDILSPNKSCS